MKDLLFGTRIVVRTFNIKISRHRVAADYVKKKKNEKNSRRNVAHVQHDYCYFYPRSTNRIIVFWRCGCR